MKRSFAIAVIICGFIPVIFAADEVVKVSLEDAYLAALKKTEIVPIEDSQKRQMDARIDQAKANFLPSITAGANYGLQPGDAKLNDQAALVLSISQPIYQGGRDYARLLVAKSQKVSNEWSLAAIRINTYSAVAQYFYNILSAEQDIKNLNATVNQTKGIIEELQKRNLIGKTKNSEVLMAQSQLAILQAELKAVYGNLALSREQFAFVTGLDKDTVVYDNFDIFPELKKLEYYMEIGSKKPDVLSLTADVQTAKENLNLEKAGGLPSLFITGDVYPIRTGSMSGVNWDIGLGINLSIFEGGNIDARIREAADKEKEAELVLSRKMRQAETEIKIAYQNLENLLEQMKVLESALIITEKNYLEQKKDYGFSLVTNLDVLQALNSFQTTKRSLDKTRIDVKASWIDLMAAVAQIPK